MMLKTISEIFPRRCFWISILLLFATSGCATLRDGGAPPPSYNVDADLKQLSQHFKPLTAVKDYYAKTSHTKDDRNVVISARLVMINLEYLKWLREIAADKQLLDTSADVLILSLNLAGTITGGEATKTVLSAVSTGVTGSKMSVDKHYFYDKTLQALIATMNANRKLVLIRILDGMNKEIKDYPFEQALSDVYEYYQAGTFMSAISAIQAESGAKEQDADKKLTRLRLPTVEEKAAVNELEPFWQKLEQVKAGTAKLTSEEAGAILKALEDMEAPGIPGKSEDKYDEKLLRCLHQVLQRNLKTSVQIKDALTKAGYPGW